MPLPHPVRIAFLSCALWLSYSAVLPASPANLPAPAATDDAVLALAPRGLAPAPPALRIAATRRLVVHNDPGGRLRPRLAQVRDLRARGVRVELVGSYCNSACTLLLGAGDVCVSADTSFGFHGPHYLDRPISRASFEYWSARMAEIYPPALRHWFMTRARFSGATPLKLSGAELIAMGFSPC